MDSAYAADIAKFKGLGLNFNAKLIGVQEVPTARGENICQEVIGRLKQNVLSSGVHKQKIVINISLEGLRMYDMKSNVSRSITFARFLLNHECSCSLIYTYHYRAIVYRLWYTITRLTQSLLLLETHLILALSPTYTHRATTCITSLPLRLKPLYVKHKHVECSVLKPHSNCTFN